MGRKATQECLTCGAIVRIKSGGYRGFGRVIELDHPYYICQPALGKSKTRMRVHAKSLSPVSGDFISELSHGDKCKITGILFNEDAGTEVTVMNQIDDLVYIQKADRTIHIVGRIELELVK